MRCDGELFLDLATIGCLGEFAGAAHEHFWPKTKRK